MPSTKAKNFRMCTCIVTLAGSLALGACTPATPPGATASTIYSDQAKVKVTGLDRSSRLITLQDAHGQMTTVRASDAVRNFDQITVGDTVKVDYQEQIEILVRGINAAPIQGVIVGIGAERAAKGQTPAAAMIVSAKRSVEIVSVDRSSHTVTFREPDGSVDSIVVQNPNNFALADGLRPGTIVDVTVTAVAAVVVQKL
jgi:hypothetical protein